MQTKTLGELAAYVGGEVRGDSNIKILAAATLGKAEEGEISFLANIKYEKQIETTRASAVIVGKDIACQPKVPLLVADDPYFAFMKIMVLLHGHRKHKKIGISRFAFITDSAKIGADCDVHNFVTVSDGARIGDRCIIYPGVFVGEGVEVGNDCIIYPNVSIYNGCKIGSRVIIHSNTTIGEDGFGFATHNGEHYKIPQIGIVILEDDVEIGACCGIERGTLGDTIIEKGTKLGDLNTIGHGTKIGPHCLLVAQVGVSGSTTLGHHCVVGGQVGITGHITVGNGVMIGAQSGVINNVGDGKIILGSPAIDANIAKRAYSMHKYLPDMRKEIRKLAKDVERLQKTPQANLSAVHAADNKPKQ
jgi:UDP-3-O-[3-hydroxymyristoyl] glucosamine N-acyltransferase